MNRKEAQMAYEKGSSYYNQEAYEKALEQYSRALKIFKERNISDKTADTLLEMANTYGNLKEYDVAFEKYEQCKALYHKNKDLIGEGYALAGMGSIMEKKGKFEESRDFYYKALKKFKKARDYERQATISFLIANTYESQEAFEDAILENRRSLNICKKINDTHKELEVNANIERLQNKMDTINPSKNLILLLFGYFFAITIAEVITTYTNTKVGLVVHTLILFALLINSSLTSSYNLTNLLRSMMALPMIRIIGLTIPIMGVQPLYWFPIISIPLFAASFVIMSSQKISRERVGLILGNLKVQLGIAASGVILGFIEFNILRPKPLIPILNLENLLIASAIIIISTGLAEELLFRGIIQKNAQNILKGLFGVFYVSLLFTSLHVGWESFPDLIFVFSVSMFYGYVFYKTESLLGITLSHGLSNTFLFLIFPFLL
ncbi:MAG: CPBP family glutamic-type intramembrane protease [Methanobacteriaceae archaeon]